jgi:cation transport ATPase
MFNFSTKEQRKIEEKLYAIVVEEIERNEINKALWAKALADSNNDENGTRAFYIKYRVQRLKDEMSDRQEAQREQQKTETQAENVQKKAEASLATLQTTVISTVYTFKWLTVLMMFAGVAGFFLAYIMYSTGDDYEIWGVAGTALILLGAYLFFQAFRISKIDDYKEVRKRLNTFFWILIPFSAVATIVSVLAPVLALAFFVACIGMIMKAVKFNNAFRYASRNQLI